MELVLSYKGFMTNQLTSIVIPLDVVCQTSNRSPKISFMIVTILSLQVLLTKLFKRMDNEKILINVLKPFIPAVENSIYWNN